MKIELPTQWQTWLNDQDKPVDDLILQALVSTYGDESESFEQRQLIGERITGNQFTANDALVFVNGIYYHYVVVGSRANDQVEKSQTYQVVSNDGNVLKLKLIK